MHLSTQAGVHHTTHTHVHTGTTGQNNNENRKTERIILLVTVLFFIYVYLFIYFIKEEKWKSMSSACNQRKILDSVPGILELSSSVVQYACVCV